MQNRYAGDVGDFGKIGLLRVLSAYGLKIGVNWYLVDDESHNDDGKHIGYLNDSQFVHCDDELLGKLGNMVYGNQRSINEIENLELIPNAVYFHDVLPSPQEAGTFFRNQWHKNAMSNLSDCDIVFLDPDNGLIVKSVSVNGKRSNKYILESELADYYLAGHSIVFYNHRSRQKEDTYLQRFLTLFNIDKFIQSTHMGIKFVRGTIRDYFFILHPEHTQQVTRAIDDLLSGPWNRHFKRLSLQ